MFENISPGYGLGGRFDRTLSEDPKPLFREGTDEYWMEQALLFSMNSVGLSSPNPSVGCILVKDNQLIASGFTQAYGKEHAERMAFQNLPPELDLREATAYVTLEPCSHFGSQPPCVDLFLKRLVKRMVVGLVDPDDRVNGQGIAKLRAIGTEIQVGTLASEASAFQFPFLANRILKKPVWIAKWAQTAGGDLANADGHSKWITGPESRAYTHWLRQKYDVIVVGARTFLRDLPKLTVRDCALPHHRNPVRVVFDPKGTLLAHPETLLGWRVLVCEKELSKFPDRLAPEVSAIPEGPLPLALRFQKALENLPYARPLQSVMVEGGPFLLRTLFENDIFDAAHIFTGTPNFAATAPKYRVEFRPDQRWVQISQHNFAEDDLREWVKRF